MALPDLIRTPHTTGRPAEASAFLLTREDSEDAHQGTDTLPNSLSS